MIKVRVGIPPKYEAPFWESGSERIWINPQTTNSLKINPVLCRVVDRGIGERWSLSG